jgi:ABC-type glycerol-3-phosphate transport system permease component
MSRLCPALTFVVLFQQVQNWNECYWTRVVIAEQIRLTLPVCIVSFRDEAMFAGSLPYRLLRRLRYRS